MRNTPGMPPGDISANPNPTRGATNPQEATGAAASVTVAEREQSLLAALRRGDEHAFAMLVDEYSPSLLRLATLYVSSRAVAEDVMQETWIGVLNGLDRFEGRSTLKTWIFRILVNIAKTRAQREARTIPFSAFGALPAFDAEAADPAVEPERFTSPDGQPDRGNWSSAASAPSSWEDVPAERLLASETRERIVHAIGELPPAQREVITLRDVDGWPSDEVCNLLGISETNQRVLLHRARSRVRRALEEYLKTGEA